MLIAESQNDDDCQLQLSVILPAITALRTKHYKEFLEGGIYSQEDAHLTTASAELHNKFAERVFTYSDQLLKFKPNISHLGMEA